MRILILDVNYDTRSPMYRQFHVSLAYCMDVDYFGPGYVSRECLQRGLKDYLSKQPEVDAIVMTTAFLNSTNDNRTRLSAYLWHRSVTPYYKVNDALQCCQKLYEELLHLKGVIKIYEQHEDVGSIQKGYYQLLKELIEHDFYILSWPIEYLTKYPRKELSNSFTNYSYELCENYDRWYIPITLHALGYHEIFIREFSDRDFMWCVPGNRLWSFYSERKAAYEFIRKHTKMWNYDPYQTLTNEKIDRKHMAWYQYHNKFEKLLTLFYGKTAGIATCPKTEYIAASREVYFDSMRQSKYVYCDGGQPNCIVRKYYETCANGAVLVAKKVPGMEQMGFVHETNCIIVDGYEDIKSIQGKYSEKQCARIAKAGQKLILEKHMYKHRAKSLAETIESIKSQRYKGAYWDNGDYVLKS